MLQDGSHVQQVYVSDSKEDGAAEQERFDDFFEEVFIEIEDCYGEIEEMNVCDNIGEHMIGNVYVKVIRLHRSYIKHIQQYSFL